jgi:demethylmenaquinone methyltransferase/2-methoxy-6-polyprenyl-1,4-benzoquinol methylase
VAASTWVFADAPGGKHEGLDLTIAALNPRGLLVVDDMSPVSHWPAELRARQAEVRRALLASPLLTSVELTCGSGVIVCARRA